MRAELITRALRGRWHGRYGTARCPSHDDQQPSLSIKDGEGGRLLLHCHAGCEFHDILAAIENLTGKITRLPPRPASPVRNQTDQSMHQLVRAIWSQTVEIMGTQGERYLRARAIPGSLPPTLRFHPSLRHPCGQRLPAMVARVDAIDRGFVGLHRTYLDADVPTKTDWSPAKAMLGPCKGGAVRLSEGRKRLVVCEGIETALSLGTGLDAGDAVLAALSASGMGSLRLPEPAAFGGQLLVATDGDPVGRRAGAVLADRAAALGWSVETVSAQ